MRLDELVEEVNARRGRSTISLYCPLQSTLVLSDRCAYFKKRVFSEDTSEYKVVERGQFAYSTIHLDEGAVGYLENRELGVISPMYKVFRLREANGAIHPAFLYRVLKSSALMEKYRSLGKGSIKHKNRYRSTRSPTY